MPEAHAAESTAHTADAQTRKADRKAGSRRMTDGEMRRMNILEILNNRTTPVSGTELAGALGAGR